MDFLEIGNSIMGWRKYFALERRGQFRAPLTIDINFYIWNEVAERPLTEKAVGRIINISNRGACLRTNTVRIENHHLVISNLGNKCPLMLEFPLFQGETSCTLKSQILWYKRISGEGEFKFECGIGFVDLSPTQQKYLHSLIKSNIELGEGGITPDTKINRVPLHH